MAEKQMKTILVVEDDAMNQTVLRMLLKKNYRIEVCDSEKSFYKILAGPDVDLILMDITLRGSKNGLQLIAEIRQNEKYRDIPVVCLTAHSRRIDEKNAINAGANVFITKPVTNKKLFDTIDKLLG